MRLHHLIDRLDLTVASGPSDVELSDLTDDSRQAQPASLFIARRGATTDGRAFVADAVARGAVAVLSEAQAPADLPPAVAWLTAAKVDQALAGCLAERFFDHPARKLRLIGVTGTNGKTTTAFVTQHLLAAAGVPCGLIGTVLVDDGRTRRPATLTTLGAVEFSRTLAAMVAGGCRAAVAELSSHALDQGRAAALDFDVAVFTNLTGDHLDYHRTMAAYAAAKARLFAALGPQAWVVVNRDDPYAGRMVTSFTGPAEHVLGTTLADPPPKGAQCRAVPLVLAADHSRARFDGPWGSVEVCVPLVGRFNLCNALQAAAAACAVTDVTDTLRQGLETCPHVPGRLQRVTAGADAAAVPQPAVLVDYAHTHDALDNVLSVLRPLVPAGAQLVVVFGCGGDRDRSKRPKMAAVACRGADRIIVTSDNPRTEDPQAIISEIMAGVPAAARDRVTVEPDRAAAIAAAIAGAAAADVVLLAGKGHEDYQVLGTTKRHFDDREQAAAALQRWHQARGSRELGACRRS